MELKTRVHAENGKHDMLITREFDLPVELLFKAFAEAEYVEQWMGTRVIKLDLKPQGAYRFETKDPRGQIHVFTGVIHDCVEAKKIVRTFEMGQGTFGVQLEFLDFEPLGQDRSQLKMHVIYRSSEVRDQILKLPFAQGINMAHNRLEQIFKTTT